MKGDLSHVIRSERERSGFGRVRAHPRLDRSSGHRGAHNNGRANQQRVQFNLQYDGILNKQIIHKCSTEKRTLVQGPFYAFEPVILYIIQATC